jgi:hypothetical protein
MTITGIPVATGLPVPTADVGTAVRDGRTGMSDRVTGADQGPAEAAA